MLNLKMVVRFSVDACLASSPGSSVVPSPTDDPDLADVMDQQTSTATTTTTSPIIDVIHAGRVDHSLGVFPQPDRLERDLSPTRALADDSDAPGRA